MKTKHNMTRCINRKQRHIICRILLFIDIFRWLQTLSALRTQLQGSTHSTADFYPMPLCTQLQSLYLQYDSKLRLLTSLILISYDFLLLLLFLELTYLALFIQSHGLWTMGRYLQLNLHFYKIRADNPLWLMTPSHSVTTKCREFTTLLQNLTQNMGF